MDDIWSVVFKFISYHDSIEFRKCSKYHNNIYKKYSKLVHTSIDNIDEELLDKDFGYAIALCREAKTNALGDKLCKIFDSVVLVPYKDGYQYYIIDWLFKLCSTNKFCDNSIYSSIRVVVTVFNIYQKYLLKDKYVLDTHGYNWNTYSYTVIIDLYKTPRMLLEAPYNIRVMQWIIIDHVEYPTLRQIKKYFNDSEIQQIKNLYTKIYSKYGKCLNLHNFLKSLGA